MSNDNPPPPNAGNEPGPSPWGGTPPGGQPPGYGQQPAPGYGHPPGYGYPPGYAPAAQTSAMAVTSLVVGILGMLCAGCLVVSITAMVLGRISLNEIARSQGAKTGAGLARAGFILGLVGLALGILMWILVAADVIHVDFTTEVS